VSRPRVERALERLADRQLILVAAPAGYGKTTAVTQWSSLMTGRQLAWVSLDAAENDPVRLWTSIATALARAGCRIDDDITGFVASQRTAITARVLPRLINALAVLGDQIVLVFDDFNLVHSRACLEQVNFFLDHLPTSATVVIISRSDPRLHLARMRVSGRMGEIRADCLAFDEHEAAVLLAGEGVQLSDAALVRLMNRTEGWAAGLYLATLSLAGRDDPNAFVEEISGNTRFIGDYLTEEVLSRQPRDLRAFMMSVSVFERFSASLCDYVLEAQGSHRVLHELERSNLFVVPLDTQRTWFRFHHLFAAVGRSELQAEGVERVKILNDRAADWFAVHGLVDDAIRHALAAGSGARAARLVQANWMRYVDEGRAATVQNWLEALQLIGAGNEPAALVTAAWMAARAGEEQLLDVILEELAEVRDDARLPDGTRSVESAVCILRALTGYGGPPVMLASALRAGELETDPSTPWYAFAQFTLGHAHYVLGDLKPAMRSLSLAAENGACTPTLRSSARAVMAWVEMERGDADRSRNHAVGSVNLMEARSLRSAAPVPGALTALGESQAAAGRLAKALSTLDEGYLLRRENPAYGPWPTIHHLLAMSRVTIAAGDTRRAEQLLQEASQLMDRFPEGMEAMRSRLASVRAALRRRRAVESGVDRLTGREADLLRLLQSPMNLTEIASELYLSRNTVKTHAQGLYRKLGARSRSDAIRIGRQRSLI